MTHARSRTRFTLVLYNITTHMARPSYPKVALQVSASCCEGLVRRTLFAFRTESFSSIFQLGVANTGKAASRVIPMQLARRCLHADARGAGEQPWQAFRGECPIMMCPKPVPACYVATTWGFQLTSRRVVAAMLIFRQLITSPLAKVDSLARWLLASFGLFSLSRFYPT